MTRNKQGFASMPKRALRQMTSEAGKHKHPNKGFGSMTPERRSEVALKGVEARRKERDGQDNAGNTPPVE